MEVRRVVRPLPSAEVYARDAIWAGVTHVFHLAARTRAPRAAALIEANVQFTERLAQAACAQAAVPRFVFASSLAAMGPALNADTPVTPEQEPCPVEAYGASKRAAEQLLQGMAALPLVIVRPAAVYGAHDRDLLAVFRQVRHPLQLRATPGWYRFTLNSVHDVVDALVAAATVPAAYAASARAGYLLSGEDVSWDALYQRIDRAVATARGVGMRRAPSVCVPAPLLAIAGRVGARWGQWTGRTPLATPDKIVLGAQAGWTCRDDLFLREAGWAPRVPLDVGLLEVARWYRAQGWI